VPIKKYIALMKRIEAKFFKTPAGNEPAREWLKDLDDVERKLIGRDLKKVEFGWPIGMPTCESMGDGIFQVRTDLPGNRISRVLFCVEEGEMHILHSFIKKTMKTPKQDLYLAKSRRKEVLKRIASRKKNANN
jgi:phage-related protein